MTDLQIFKNDTFGQVRAIEQNGNPWFVAKDVCDVFGATNRNRIMQDLDADEKGYTQMNTPGGIQEVAIVNESGLYQLLFSLQPAKARGVRDEYIQERVNKLKAFKRWVTHDVIPSIRKTGSYSLAVPKSLPEALRAYANEVESHNATKAIVAQQEQQIAEFKPVKDYVDKILSSKSCLTITQIAADYGMSAQELNKILHEAGLQRKVGDQWILYKQHMSKGFTKSETFTFCRSDGRLDSKITTKWTQKGRLEIHNILSNLDIHAVCENMA